MELIIKGRIPSKKNQKQIIYVKGRPLIISSKAHKEWHTEQLWLLKGKTCVTDPISVQITIYAPDKRKADLTNKAESLMDLLVDAKIIEDDNWFIIPNISLHFGGVDKNNPRAEITIK